MNSTAKPPRIVNTVFVEALSVFCPNPACQKELDGYSKDPRTMVVDTCDYCGEPFQVALDAYLKFSG